MFLSCSNLEDCHNGPEKRVKVLPVWQGVSIPLRAKLTTEQMHPKDTEKLNNNNSNSRTENVPIQLNIRTNIFKRQVEDKLYICNTIQQCSLSGGI